MSLDRRTAVVVDRVLADPVELDRVADAISVVAATSGCDPYDLARLVTDRSVDDVLLAAPRRFGVRRLVPGPAVGGRPVGIVQADDWSRPPVASPEHRERNDVPWVVAAMAKNVFLRPTDSWADRLGRAHPTIDLRADRARRDDLLTAVAAGPSILLYAGHGSPRGWTGYQALRTRHVEDLEMARPVDLTIAFACNTLSRPRNAWPFGSRLVELGVTRCYLAPAESVITADAEALGDLVVDLLASGHWASVGSLTGEIDRCAVGPARRAWSTFRLLGDPRTVFDSSATPAVAGSASG